MTAIFTLPSQNATATATRFLRGSAAFWFVTAALGQLVFALYIAAFYGRTALSGNFDEWNNVLRHGVIAGDGGGNAALGAHLLLAFLITVGGPLQLVPRLRTRFPAIHRLIGRCYILTACIMSLGGLYLVWSRIGIPGTSVPNAVAISINAILILGCAAMAWRFGVARDIRRHRIWALRLFVVVSGVWFLRVGVMLWILVAGPAGLGDNLTGPVGVALNFAQYLLPLMVLELYLRARSGKGNVRRGATAALLSVLTVGMGAGIVMATIVLWAPHF